jgi:hypothetical protein
MNIAEIIEVQMSNSYGNQEPKQIRCGLDVYRALEAVILADKRRGEPWRFFGAMVVYYDDMLVSEFSVWPVLESVNIPHGGKL